MTTYPARKTIDVGGLTALILSASPGSFIRQPPRKRRHYLRSLTTYREILHDIDREKLPKEMTSLPELIPWEDDLDLEWLAMRDALLERALALGYIIGQLTDITIHQSWWVGEVVGTIGSRAIRYPVSGPMTSVHAAPEIGQAVLMTRGYDAKEGSYRGNRPYIPVGAWFLQRQVVDAK